MANPAELLGSWKMVTWQREFADTGEKDDAQGPNPLGYIYYTADGRVSTLVVRNDRSAPTSVPVRDDEKIKLFDSMIAYTGTYTLHDDRVVHHIDASWNQGWTGTDQVRFYKLVGGRLVISSAPAPDPYTGREVVHRIEFQRIPKSK